MSRKFKYDPKLSHKERNNISAKLSYLKNREKILSKRLKNREFHNKNKTEWYYKNKEKVKEYDRKRNFHPSRIYTVYNKNAEDRKLSFTLTRLDFMLMPSSCCFYCNRRLDKIRLDRINPHRGYNRYNIVFCCRKCNILKWDYSKQDFIGNITVIYENQPHIKQLRNNLTTWLI